MQSRRRLDGAASAGTATLAPPPPAEPPRPAFLRPVAPREREEGGSIRKIGFYFALAFVFARFSFVHEILSYFSGFDLHLITLVGVPAVILVVIGGGIRRTLVSRTAFYWLAFALWLVLATPFSSWRGGSAGLVSGYLKAELPMLFIVAGMVTTWREFRLLLGAVSLAAIFNVVNGRLFQAPDDGGGRLRLDFGSIANANDFVAHLLFVLPFLLFFAMSADSSRLRKLVSWVMILGGLFLVSRSASRGGLVAFAAVCCFVVFRGSVRQRIGFVAGVSVLLAISVVVLPSQVLVRYATLFSNRAAQEDSEAADSQRARTYLLKSSLADTFQHPLFGVGPGEFSDYEGGKSRALGEHGVWAVTHNAYTQASSECGIPALLFALAGIFSTFFTLNRIYRAARGNHAFRGLALASYCLQISLIGYCVAIIFLALMYTLYLPAIAGFSIALESVARSEFARIGKTQIPLRSVA